MRTIVPLKTPQSGLAEKAEEISAQALLTQIIVLLSKIEIHLAIVSNLTIEDSDIDL